MIFPRLKYYSLALLVPGLLIFSTLSGAPVDSTSAVGLARNFYLRHLPEDSFLKGSKEFKFSLAHREYGQWKDLSALKSEAVSSPLYYVINVGETDGYVIVAGDDRIPAVLGYSFSGSYSANNQPPAFQEWMENYKDQISFIIANDLEGKEDAAELWDSFGGDSMPRTPMAVEEVSPLIEAHWNQGCYYNSYCPDDTEGPCDHALVGCVAVAMAQIIHYWEHPAYVDHIPGYTHSTYGWIEDITQISYDWSAMSNTLHSSSTSAELEAVGSFLYHCGVAVQMNYGPEGSSAYSGRAHSALQDFFSFSDESLYLSKDSYSNSEWEELLRTELDHSRPVYYRGNSDEGGGHAFICDGYMGSDFFHFNWGWGGSHDGYFYLDPLNADAINYHISQWAIMGIMPDNDPCNHVIPIGGCGPGHVQSFSSASLNGIWDLNLCGFEANGSEQVYSFVAPVSGTYSIELTATGDQVLYGWSTACHSSGWNCIGELGSQQGSYGAMEWTAGESYYLILKGLDDVGESHQFHINCPEDTPPDLQLDYYLFDDDNNGESSGDGDGRIEPGETIELTFWIFNNGPGDAEEAGILLESTNSHIQFVNQELYIGPIAAGDSRSGSGKISFSVHEDCPEGDILFNLNVYSVQQDRDEEFSLHIHPPPADPCDYILPISGCGPEHSQYFTSEFSRGSWDLTLCSYEATGPERIFSFVAPESGTYSIELTSAGTQVLYGWNTSCSPEAWNCIGNLSNQPGTYGSMDWIAGTTYYLLLKGQQFASETQRFHINCPEPPPANLRLDHFSIDDDDAGESSGDGDGRIEPGETIELLLSLYNEGPGNAENAGANLECSHADIQFLNQDIFFGNIPAEESRSGTEAFTFTVGEDCPEGDLVFSLNAYTVQQDWNEEFSLHVYPPPEDPCEHIISIGGCGSAHTRTFSSESRTGSWNLNLCGYEAYGTEQVYSFVAPESGVYSMELTAAGDPVLYAWSTSCNPDEWNCIGTLGTQPGSYGSMDWTAGITYYILLKGLDQVAETHQFHLTCPVPAALPLLGIFNQQVDDDFNQSGDNNGVPEPGESFRLSLWVNNTGEGDAHNVFAGLSTDDPYITISDSDDFFGFVPAGEYKKCQDGFVVTISEACPERVITFNLAISSEEGVWFDQLSLTVITGIFSTPARESRLLVFPNPAENLLFLESENAIETPLKISLMDNNGRCLLVKELDRVRANEAIAVDVSNFSSGVYFLSVTYSDRRMYHKIIKLQ